MMRMPPGASLWRGFWVTNWKDTTGKTQSNVPSDLGTPAIPQEEMGNVSGERDLWVDMLRQLPL